MLTISGRISTFGGKDSGMAHTENLSLYWQHWQCDERPDLFHPRSKDLTEGTSHRLKEDAFYCAFRFDPMDKEKLRNEKIKITNPFYNKSCLCDLTDWGPAEWTGRVMDVSPGVAEYLALETDQEAVLEVDI